MPGIRQPLDGPMIETKQNAQKRNERSEAFEKRF
jgi:hypothetical protein